MFCMISPFICGSIAAAEDAWTFSNGADYSSGDYNNTTDTSLLYLPLRAEYHQGNWSGKISSGWLHINGPGRIVEPGIVLPGGSARSESGIADTWLSLSYRADMLPPVIGVLDVTGKVKLPTADKDKGLGTGKVDYALQVDYSRALGDLTPMLTTGYKFTGDPQDMPLRDILYISAGLDWRVVDNASVGASLDFQQASVSGMDEPLEVLTYLNHKINDRITISPYFYHGLSSSSPDIGLGVQMALKL